MTEIAEQRIQSLEHLLSSQPNSPLFAQLADFYIEAGRAQDALRLCDRGLAHHPFYTTGHLIKGKALLALNMKSEARREFELVHDAFPLNESLSRTLSQIPQGEEETLTAPPPPEPAAQEESPAPPVAAEPQAEASPAEADAGQLMTQFTEPETSAPVAEPAAAAEDPFGLTAEAGGAPPEAETAQAETYEQFADRKRGELFGMENSVELENYLNEAPQQPEPAEAPAEPAAVAEPESASEEPEDPFAMITEPAATADEQTTETPEDPFAMVAEPAPPEDQQPTQAPEDPFATVAESAPPEDQQPTQAPEDPFATLTEPETTEETPEDPFATLGEPPAVTEQPATEQPETEQPPAETTEDPFAALTALAEEEEQKAAETTEIISTSPPDSPQTTSDDAPDDPFAQLAQAAEKPGEQETGENQIEEFAEKLKDAKKITPIINLSEKETTPQSEQETPSGTGFVTPTLAEIYAKQGWYDDAIKAYKALANSKPLEKEKFEKRIQELEEQKKRQDSIG